jgi:hypothetical protein
LPFHSPRIVLAADVDVTLTDDHHGGYTVSWKEVQEATNYTVYWCHVKKWANCQSGLRFDTVDRGVKEKKIGSVDGDISVAVSVCTAVKCFGMKKVTSSAGALSSGDGR